MSDEPITTAQLRTLQAEFSKLRREDDPRTNGPNDERFDDTREGRIAWAKVHLGRPRLESFNELTKGQAEYLIDTLKRGHNQSKLDKFIGSEFRRMGIEDPASYFSTMIAGASWWKYGGRDLYKLNRYQKCALARTLSTRRPSPPRSAPSPRARVSEEQNQLWPGM